MATPPPPPPLTATTTPSVIPISDAYLQIQRAFYNTNTGNHAHAHALPSPAALSTARASLPPAVLPSTGHGDSATLAHLIADLSPALNGSATSPHYYGFVTGGVLPVAAAADALVTACDQNVQVHLPAESASTVIEDRAACWLVQLLDLDLDPHGSDAALAGAGRWQGRTFTTGATASNVLGLACGREAVLQKRLWARGESGVVDEGGDGVGELGILEACRRAWVVGFQVLTTMGHSSLYKASSIVGLGRKSVKDVGARDQPWKFDLQKLEMELGREGIASIVAVSCGEVNTGRFATSNREEMEEIRELCDRYGAWLHVDGGEDSDPFAVVEC
jgi:glutamate/tyrosine decarboxylase-like PLP-dependent enzyme